MKSNESKNKINIIFQKDFSKETLLQNKDKNSLLKNKEIEKTLFVQEKIKLDKKNIFKKKINLNSNSQLLLYNHKNNKNVESIKLPNNIHNYKNKEDSNKIKNNNNNNNNTLDYNTGLNKSQSINNLKTIFPIINKKSKISNIKTNINNSNNNSNDTNKNKTKKSIRIKFPTTERNFFNNYLNNMNKIKTAKFNHNYLYNEKEKEKENNIKINKYKYIVRPENCGYLIINCFKHRKNWIEIKNDYENQNFHFKWQQNIKNIYYNTLSKICGYKQMVNHFEFHNVLTNKANLFYNMMKYAELLDENVFKYIPFTILFEYNNDNFFKKIEKFQHLFNNIQSYIVDYNDINNIKYKHKKGRLYSVFFPFDNFLGSKTAVNIIDTHFYIPEINNENNINNNNDTNNVNEEKKGEEKTKDKTINKNKKINNNLWLIKAPNLNRGMCIKILNDINLIQKYITYYNRGILKGYNDNKEKEIRSKSLTTKKINILDKEKEDINNIYQSSTIIIQKYIEKPLLYFGRKFDIRIWVLLTHDLKVYVFNEGHLKCCSVKYDLSCKDNYSHLTNYSFQKYNDNFGKYEWGNEVSFDDLQNNIDINYNHKVNFKRDIIPKIHDIVKFCFQSVKSKINSMNRKYTFEIFGFDFMIDCNFHPFLIEINTNPGLEESSPLIKMLVPRMLDDALRLTVDKEFDTIYNIDGMEFHSNDKNNDYIYQSPFPVNGYLNSENIFKFVCDLTINEKIKSKKMSFRKFNFNKKI